VASPAAEEVPPGAVGSRDRRGAGPALLPAARFAVGVGCVCIALLLIAQGLVPETRSLSNTVGYYGYISSALGRVLTTGDSLDIPLELQGKALDLLAGGGSYALRLAPSQAAAVRDGINPITYAVVTPFLEYLLLPAQPARPADAGYLICYGCDARAWRGRVRWLWSDGAHAAIGRLGG
jgi:hypothetical protein